jgi:uncharacterized protein
MTRLFLLMWTLFCTQGCAQDGMPTATIRVGAHSMTVEVAKTAKDRAKGLMYRDSLGANRGMLFVYEVSAERSFWMKNTRIPLSIAFADEEGTITRIADMRPLSKKHTSSQGKSTYALEVNKGWFDTHDVHVGDKLQDLPTIEAKAD